MKIRVSVASQPRDRDHIAQPVTVEIGAQAARIGPHAVDQQVIALGKIIG